MAARPLYPQCFCSHACACYHPLKRDAKRPPQQILAEAAKLANQGEITVLGQSLTYGLDQPGYPSLAALLRQLHAIEGIQRIRFLITPNWFSDGVGALAELP